MDQDTNDLNPQGFGEVRCLRQLFPTLNVRENQGKSLQLRNESDSDDWRFVFRNGFHCTVPWIKWNVIANNLSY